MAGRQLKELLGMMMIGEGVTAAIAPIRHARLWEIGPKPLRRLTKYLEDRPKLTVALAATEVGLGVWLTLRQLRR